MKNRIRKVIGLFTALSLTFTGLLPMGAASPLQVFAAEDAKEMIEDQPEVMDTGNETEIIPGISWFGSFNDDKADLPVRYFYSDDYFVSSHPATEYNQHLATMSLILAMSGFSSNLEWNGDKKIYDNQCRNARWLMDSLGFGGNSFYRNKAYTEKPGKDTIGVAIGHKDIKAKNGEEFTLVAVTLRGAGYESEWASNAKVGEGSGDNKAAAHEGFSDAANTVLKEIQGYINAQGLKDKPLKYWIAGYSRAGATANIAGYKITQDPGSYMVMDKSADNIYVYDFEAPQGGTGLSAPNVHNIVNPGDIVPLVSPSAWGTERFGTDYIIGNLGSESYKKNRKLMKEKLDRLSKEVGDIYNNFPDQDKINLYGLTIWYTSQGLNKLKNKTRWLNSFMDSFIGFVATSPALKGDDAMASGRNRESSGIRKAYAGNYQDDIRWLISWLMGGGFMGKLLEEGKKNTIDAMGLFSGGAGFLWDLRSVRQCADVKKDHAATDGEKKKYKGYMNDVIGYLMGYDKHIPGVVKTLDSLKDKGAYTDTHTREDAERVTAGTLRLLVNLLADDYRETGQDNINIGTAASLGSSLITAHIPEVTLSWMMAFDSYYNNDSGYIADWDYKDILLPYGISYDVSVYKSDDEANAVAAWTGNVMKVKTDFPLGGYIGIIRYQDKDFYTYRIPRGNYIVKVTAPKSERVDDLDFYIKSPSMVREGYSVNEDVFYSDPKAGNDPGKKIPFDSSSELIINLSVDGDTEVFKNREITVTEVLSDKWEEGIKLSDVREALVVDALKTKKVPAQSVWDMINEGNKDDSIVGEEKKLEPEEKEDGRTAESSFTRFGKYEGYSLTPLAKKDGNNYSYAVKIYPYDKETGKKGDTPLMENVLSYLDTDEFLFSGVDDILIEYVPVGICIRPAEDEDLSFKILQDNTYKVMDKEHEYATGSDLQDVTVAWPYYGAVIERNGKKVSVNGIDAGDDAVFETGNDGLFHLDLDTVKSRVIRIKVKTAELPGSGEPERKKDFYMYAPQESLYEWTIGGNPDIDPISKDCWKIPAGTKVVVKGKKKNGVKGWDILRADLLSVNSISEEEFKHVEGAGYEFDMPESDVYLFPVCGSVIRLLDDSVSILSKEELCDEEELNYSFESAGDGFYSISFNGTDRTVYLEIKDEEEFYGVLQAWVLTDTGEPDYGDPVELDDPGLSFFTMPTDDNIALSANYIPMEYEFQVWNGTAEYRKTINGEGFMAPPEACHGTLPKNAALTLIANEPEAGSRFSHWEVSSNDAGVTADIILEGQEDKETADVIMPGSDVIFTAVYETIPPANYQVTVNGGRIYEGEDNIEAPYEDNDGKRVYTLSEDRAYRIEHEEADNSTFTGWDDTDNDIRFFKDGSPVDEGYFTMPDHDVSFNAVYVSTHKVTVENGYITDEAGNKIESKEFTSGTPVFLMPDSYNASCRWISKDSEVQSVLDEIAGRGGTENGASMFVMPDRDVVVRYEEKTKKETFSAGGHSYEVVWNESVVFNGKKTKADELGIKVTKDGAELPASDYKAVVKGKTQVSASGNKAPYIRLNFKNKADKDAKKEAKKLKFSFLVTERSLNTIELTCKKAVLKNGKVKISGLSWKNSYGKKISLKKVNSKGKGDISVGEPVVQGDETCVWISGVNNYKGSARLILK